MGKQAARELKLESIDQIGIVVRDIDKVIESWSKLLRIGPWNSTEMETTDRAGRALKKLGVSNYEISEEPPVSACSAASSPIIFPDGRVIACIGPVISLGFPHPLVLGNLRERTLHEILDNAESNPILHTIRVWGPRKLISMIKEAGLGRYLPKRYIKDSVCNACFYLVSNSNIIDFLGQLARDSEFQGMVTYARAYYLNERVPPQNEPSSNARLAIKKKGVTDGQEGVQTRVNHQQAA
jgi:hypothetical protein